MNIAVYCGASSGNSEEYKQITEDLGNWIGENQCNLIYGGGNAGLMGIIAETILKANGEVTGIMPDFLVDRELAKDNLTSLIIVSDMHERKKKMIETANLYIALPGGPGTIEEITEVISWGRIGQHFNPCILINHKGFFNPLKQQYQLMVDEGFLTQEDFDKILFADSLDEIQPFFDSFTPPNIREYKQAKTVLE
ncbi:TIGR00730 family Rossman fold protein [Melissococcus plutonius]|uniref:Cytokinin riboside 5'-monophosphate phosphoribohydrolase n=1 Tax=Melissococcus plutonius TaxID=33970 RepID=A0A2Z5Y4M9_9ENTE|nr:TIGR00730 family Rossman fold protein [Melissococcus plutonius]BAL62857.1 decarboxylase family protein [Melissococcus plutonius DAT561]MCV2498962.1 TIGR00730 family Rossman fold protein [Melissococcus plutonius]MCV2501723.1 TIGR00730 family Rossman fold protein [Melissococcus plutonius]MCV2505410.1 TIGR00730 family Rossman fold protein [Melissococcus plutonius]MCV2507763.1 TIGR00730 family Rossman fold protein [Melissococcus plutonius]